MCKGKGRADDSQSGENTAARLPPDILNLVINGTGFHMARSRHSRLWF